MTVETLEQQSGTETSTNDLNTLSGEAAELAEIQSESDNSSQEETTTDDSGSIETTETTKTKTETETTTSEGDNDNTATETAENVDTETTVEGDDNSDSSQEKPQKGFVPYGAVKEVRQKNSQLKAENDALNLRIEELSKKPLVEESTKDEFKVLSVDEFNDLLEDDPDEAARYNHKLVAHQQQEVIKAKNETYLKEAENYNKSVVDNAYVGIQEIITSQEVAQTVRQAGIEAGLNEGAIGILTDPSTKFTVTGENGEQTYLLGDSAVQVVQVLKTIADNNPEKIRAKIREELTASITKEITDKIKNPDATISLDDGLTASGDMGGKNFEDMSEAEWNSLSDAQRDKALKG